MNFPLSSSETGLPGSRAIYSRQGDNGPEYRLSTIIGTFEFLKSPIRAPLENLGAKPNSTERTTNV